MNAKLTGYMKGMEALKEYTPKGCPFKGYTLYDLVEDMWTMYSWMVTKDITVPNFIRMLMDKDAHAHTYGADMIMIYEEATRYAVQ